MTSLSVPPAAPGPFTVVGAPGFAIYGGYLVEHEADSRLQGRQKYVTYSDLLANVAIVASGVRFFLNLVAKAEWAVEPADDSAEALRLAELTEELLHDMRMPWHRVVRRAALFKFYGYSLQEWTVKLRDDGVVGFDAVDPRAQVTIERWDSDDNGRVVGVWQRRPQDQRELYIPRWKMVYLVDDSLNDSPEGLGLFRHLAKPAARLERYELLEGWGYETDLRGIPIGYAPLAQMEMMVKKTDLDPVQAAKLREPLEKFIRGHVKSPALGMLLDSSVYSGAGESRTPSGNRQWGLELLKGAAGPHGEIAAAIERETRNIARVLGVEHLLLGSSDRGSYALSVDKSQAFGMIVDSALREIRETFQQDLIAPLWALNGWDPKLKPRLKTDQAQYRDIEQVTGALADMAKAGATIMPDDPVVNEVRDLLGLSHAPEVDLSLSAPPSQPDSQPDSQSSPNGQDQG